MIAVRPSSVSGACDKIVVRQPILKVEVVLKRREQFEAGGEIRESTSIFRKPTLSNTSCNGTGMNTGPMSTAQVNCQTVTPGGESQAVTTRKLDVENIVDANGERFTIRCTANWIGSNCLPMKDGDQFQAEYDGKTTMWVTARKGGNLGKPVSAKYKVLDRRPVPTVAGSSAIVAAAQPSCLSTLPHFPEKPSSPRPARKRNRGSRFHPSVGLPQQQTAERTISDAPRLVREGRGRRKA